MIYDSYMYITLKDSFNQLMFTPLYYDKVPALS